MEISTATETLSALAHDGRLAAFRLLVQAGKAGLPAGEIGRRLGILANTLSTHLSILAAAGLVRSRRDGRQIVYTVDYDRMAALLSYLAEDCCGGAPEICAPLAQISQAARCAPLTPNA